MTNRIVRDVQRMKAGSAATRPARRSAQEHSRTCVVGEHKRKPGMWRTRKALLPSILGALLLLSTAGLAVILLGDGLLMYGLLAVGGLTGIYVMNTRSDVRARSSRPGLGSISVEAALYSLTQIAAARDQ